MLQSGQPGLPGPDLPSVPAHLDAEVSGEVLDRAGDRAPLPDQRHRQQVGIAERGMGLDADGPAERASLQNPVLIADVGPHR